MTEPDEEPPDPDAERPDRKTVLRRVPWSVERDETVRRLTILARRHHDPTRRD